MMASRSRASRPIYAPRFGYTDRMVDALGRIEAARAVIEVLPLPPDEGLELRLRAVQKHTRSSTAIEGNTLGERDFRRAIVHTGPRLGPEAEQEVRNYWLALERVEDFAEGGQPPTQAFIQALHGMIIVRLRGRRSPSRYRKRECPVVDSSTGTIDYAPPEPKDVPRLMEGLEAWLHDDRTQTLPAPVRAAILSHRFLSIHPFDDGNGRTARLLATAELWRSGYHMRGFFSFEEFFEADRATYYRSLQMTSRSGSTTSWRPWPRRPTTYARERDSSMRASSRSTCHGSDCRVASSRCSHACCSGRSSIEWRSWSYDQATSRSGSKSRRIRPEIGCTSGPRIASSRLLGRPTPSVYGATG
jgi:Fic family protein